jgi:hypothetical protein
MTPRFTFVSVPSHWSAVNQLGPANRCGCVSAASENGLVPLPQSSRTVVVATVALALFVLRLGRRCVAVLARRSSTIGFLLSVLRDEFEGRGDAAPPLTVRLPVSVLSRSAPLVTSTVEL